MTHSRSMEPPAWKPIDAFFARESESPLTDAFAGRRAVHPFVGMSPVPEQEWLSVWSEMTAGARSGKSVAYIHVPFCENHCLFCGFYQNAWHSPLGGRYVDALVDHLRRDRDRPYQSAGPIHAVAAGHGERSEGR